jgi:uncharacterized protein (DUF58 family)
VTRPLGLLLLAAAVAAGAEILASMALFAVGVGLALLTVCAGVTVALAARRVTVARTVVQREVQEDDPVRVRFHVRGTEWLPVRVEAADESGTWLDLGSPGAFAEVRIGRRGEYRLLPSRLRVRDALGIFEWSLHAGPAEPLLILPTPTAHGNLYPRHPTASGDPEPDGLQAHSPGVPLARIHWPALARGAGLQVRRLSASPIGLPLVVVDTAGAENSLAVDWAARTAAGHILALARSGGCRVLLPGDAIETTVVELEVGWRALHRRLARLDGSVPGRPPRLAAGTPAIRIRASAAPAALLRALPQVLPPGVVPLASQDSEAGV